jgi:hypothetical protein
MANRTMRLRWCLNLVGSAQRLDGHTKHLYEPQMAGLNLPSKYS